MPDPRRVFVVHGRNEPASNALFAFLRSIDLDPIEWGEAIELTGHGSPYPGQALEVAFSRAQAAVVLLTGDDMARLGTRFLKHSDKDHERDLTPQCRPNVLFEAGMAFGKHPERTIVVALGETRPFSDILGRHIIHLTSPTWRHELADRLRNARCEVKTENRRQWLTEGNFEAIDLHPDLANTPSPAKPDIDTTPNKINYPDLYYPRMPDAVKEQQQSAGQPPNPLLADGGAEYMMSSPDDFIVRIVRYESTATKGLILNIINERLAAIAKTRLIIRSAQSFDSRRNEFRDGRTFMPFDATEQEPIEAGCNGKGTLLVYKKSSHPHLFAGNDDRHPLEWPENDKAPIHKWLIYFEVLAFAVPVQQGDPGIPLRSVKRNIIVIWNPSKNEFSIEEAQDQPA